MSSYERIKEVVAYENRRVTIFDDVVRRPDGQVDSYFRVRYKHGTGGAVILPQLPDGRLLMLRIHRYAFDDDSLEFPRGGAKLDEPSEATAARELGQETGLKADSLVEIGHCRPDTSIMQVDAAVFIARLPASAETAVAVESREAIEGSEWLAFDQIQQRIASGVIRDGFTLSAVALYSAHRLRD
jgi:ADP-ribose pyrophosphatase